MRILVCALVVYAAVSLVASAQPPPLSSYKRIYVSPMPDGMDEFIVAELVKWGKVQVVTSAEKADAILTAGMEGKVGEVKSSGSAVVPTEMQTKEEKRKGGRSKQSLWDIHTGAIKLVDPKTESVLWAASRSDTWRWWSGGTRTVAQKLCKQFRKDYEKASRR